MTCATEASSSHSKISVVQGDSDYICLRSVSHYLSKGVGKGPRRLATKPLVLLLLVSPAMSSLIGDRCIQQQQGKHEVH
jgi:hypothetical protein